MAKKQKKEDQGAKLASEVASLTESEAIAALEATKEIICRKAQNISQQKAQLKDVSAGFKEVIKFLSEEQETELVRKGLIEDHLKVLGAANAE